MPLVWLWSLTLSLVALGPLLGGGHWLWADAVSVPRSFLVDQAFGLADAAPRATPQDAALAAVSNILDGGLVVKAITVLALFAAGTGAARLVREFLPESSWAVHIVAATFAIDNLWVVERLLQGQWSLLVGYGALGHVAVVAARLRNTPSASGWAELGFWLAAGGLVPTGALLVAVLAGLVLAAPGGARWWRRTAAFTGLAIVAASPWAAAGLFGLCGPELADGGAAGAHAFATRPDRAGWLALGGIWNAGSTPDSQRGAWGLAADLALVALVAAGAFLLRRRLRQDRAFALLFALGLAAVALVGLSATGFAQSSLAEAMATTPALGVLRDGQKWAALAWPAYALALSWIAMRAKQWACALVPVVLLLVPDALWGAGGRLAPVRYPNDWFEVRSLVAADPSHGALLTVPVGITRQYDWAGRRTSIDPAPRLLPVPVAQSGDLVVAGAVVPGEGALARRAAAHVRAGAGPERFAEDSIGWVLVERDQLSALPPAALAALARFELVRSDQHFDLYRNPLTPWPVPAVPDAARRVVVAAHLAWAALLACGAAGALWRRRAPGARLGRIGGTCPDGFREKAL
ncbi:conserved hypothetical protein [Segniliparus rotundus DSM 44985]|uniref:Transmembrane protein n=1 Tax=Segniliparus rotundus (strain ATCC BAA-972 / CDC 1076 / CIP 108378 / DSM 44985 / JCM 13578) TaxID=640132 RepID=D6ZA69_SEGRD|nr:hypothetical protein [Segniliparus rotundus]ADG96611.1 conserved hypothetical protein [Segniliparus rotundus DSM 44985]